MAAVGLIGGPPECLGSYLGLDMGVSVVMGTPCLDTYAVLGPGPTLALLVEGALSVVRERVPTLARRHGVSFADVSLHAMTALRLRLGQTDDRARRLQTSERLRPRQVLLDPLVRLHAADEKSATEVARLLAGLRDLQPDLDRVIVLVHHTCYHRMARGRSLW